MNNLMLIRMLSKAKYVVAIVFTLVILPVGLHWLEKHEAKRYQRLIDKPGE